jgi:hypothetical protein
VRIAVILLLSAFSTIAVGVELYWIGWAMRLTATTAPWWVTAVVLACHLAVCLGLARLIDKRGHLQEQ